MCKWLSVEGKSPRGIVPLRDSDNLVMSPLSSPPLFFYHPSYMILDFGDGPCVTENRLEGREGVGERKARMKTGEDGALERLEL